VKWKGDTQEESGKKDNGRQKNEAQALSDREWRRAEGCTIYAKKSKKSERQAGKGKKEKKKR